MKQVIGAPFSGLLNQQLELEIVNDLVNASRRKFDDPGLHFSEQRKLLDQAFGSSARRITREAPNSYRVESEDISRKRRRTAP